MKTPENPSAFPITEQNGANCGEMGMSLRDYFAGLAMQTLLQCQSDAGFAPKKRPTDQCAHLAYEVADAMLAARSTKDEAESK